MMKKLIFILVCSLFLLDKCFGRVVVNCKKDSDCPLNAFCEGGNVCFCKDGYIDEIEETLHCLKEASKYGEECLKDIQCNSLLGLRSNCFKQDPRNEVGKCICHNDSHYKEGICHRKSYIGDKCVVSSDCFILTKGVQSYCSEGKCICPPKHIPSDDKMNCIAVAGLEERCSSNVTCIVPNSKCDVYCQCKMGFVSSQDNLHCLKVADTLNDSCIEDAQCSEFLKLTQCDKKSGKCDCQKFAHRLRDQCWMTVEMLGLCEHDSECYVPGDRTGVICKDGSCACKQGYLMSGSSCNQIGQAKIGPGSNSSQTTSIVFSLLLLCTILSTTKMFNF